MFDHILTFIFVQFGFRAPNKIDQFAGFDGKSEQIGRFDLTCNLSKPFTDGNHYKHKQNAREQITKYKCLSFFIWSFSCGSALETRSKCIDKYTHFRYILEDNLYMKTTRLTLYFCHLKPQYKMINLP